MREETDVDRSQRSGARWSNILLVAYIIGVILLFASREMGLMLFALFNVPLIAFLLARRFLGTALDDAPVVRGTEAPAEGEWPVH